MYDARALEYLSKREYYMDSSKIQDDMNLVELKIFS